MIGSADSGLDRIGCAASIGVRAEQNDRVHAISLTTMTFIHQDPAQKFLLIQHYT